MNGIKKTEQAIRDAGIPDMLNRWIGMTPERLAEINATINRRKDIMISLKTNPKVTPPGPKEQQQRELAAARSSVPSVTPKKKPQNLHQALAAAQGRHLDATLLGDRLPTTPPKPEASAPASNQESSTVKVATKTKPGTRGDAANQKARTKLTPTTAKSRREPGSARRTSTAARPVKPDMKATTKGSGAKTGESKSDIVHRMLTSAKGATRVELSKASGWPYVNLKTAAARADMALQEKEGRFKLVPKPAKAGAAAG